jgi:hypothetical protein
LFDGDAVWVVVQSMLQAVAKNYGVSNSETEVGLAQNIMDLAIPPKLTDLDKVLLIRRC